MFDLESHTFFGSAPEFVVVVAGIHTSEQSGVEVAHWVRTKLAARSVPTRLGAIVVPEMFPAQGEMARAREWEVGAERWSTSVCNEFRNPIANRHFPPPGKALSTLADDHLETLSGGALLDRHGSPAIMLPEIKRLVQLIELVGPTRIVSIHGKKRRTRKNMDAAVRKGVIAMSEAELDRWHGEPVKGVNSAGIFVDPRFSVRRPDEPFLDDAKFDRAADPAFPAITAPGVAKVFDSARSADGRLDDALCLSMARAIRHPELVAGNHLDSSVPVVHYAKENVPPGFSLGDWAAVATDGLRPAAPVFTIEVDQNHESWAFLDGVPYVDHAGRPIPQPKRPSPSLVPAQFDSERSARLQDYADAIIDHCLA